MCYRKDYAKTQKCKNCFFFFLQFSSIHSKITLASSQIHQYLDTSKISKIQAPFIIILRSQPIWSQCSIFILPEKPRETLRFSVSRGYRSETLTWNGLIQVFYSNNKNNTGIYMNKRLTHFMTLVSAAP